MVGDKYMKSYYLGNIPFNSEDAISHGRTKGSKNGISTTPGYKAIGQLAKGHVGSIGNAASRARGVTSNTASFGYASTRKKATEAYNSGKKFATKTSSFSTKGGKKKSGGKHRVVPSDPKYEKTTSKAHKKDLHKAAQKVVELRSNQRKFGNSLGNTSNPTGLHSSPRDYLNTVSNHGPTNVHMTGTINGYSLASAWDRLGRIGTRRVEKEEKKLDKKVKKFSAKLKRNAKISEIKSDISRTAGETKEFLKRQSGVTVSALKSAYSKVVSFAKSLFGKLFK